MTPLEIIRKYSEQPIEPASFGCNLKAAINDLLGDMGVAITQRNDEHSSQLLYFINHKGEELLPIPNGLLEQSVDAGRLVNVKVNEWLVPSELDFTGAENIANAFNESVTVARIAWELGGYAKFDILLLSAKDAEYLGRVSENLQILVNFIATTILRRVEKGELQKAQAWIEKELDEIAKLQQLLRPDNLEEIECANFSIFSEAYRYAGGDYYDISRLIQRIPDSEEEIDTGRFAMGVADVSGHGPSAVMELAMLDAILRTYSDSYDFVTRERGPHSVVNYLNRNMFTRKPRASFATGFFSVYDPSNRMLRHSNAGHPAPIWKRTNKNECVELPITNDIPIRILKDYEWSVAETYMEPGDYLITYTDGVTEHSNAEGEEYGSQRLLQLVAETKADSSQSLLETIKQSLMDFSKGRAPEDDMTILVTEFV